MITIQETRELTLYLVDGDGQPVRAATSQDILDSGFVEDEAFEAIMDERDTLRAQLKASQAALTEQLAARASEPLHPAIARVVEAARATFAKTCWPEQDIEDIRQDAAEQLELALENLPSPLPRVVTCGECVNSWATSERHIHCGQWGRVFLASDYCSSGKRREP